MRSAAGKEVPEFLETSVRVGTWALDLVSNHLWWSPDVFLIHGLADNAAQPDVDSAINFYAPEDRPRIRAAVEAGIKTGAGWDLELQIVTRSGERRWVRATGQVAFDDNTPRLLHGCLIDVDRIKHAQGNARRMARELDYRRTHDTLTGLPNRVLFETELAELLAEDGHGENRHAVLFMDLDRFKIINDTCGHAAGDQLLREVSALMKRALRRGDTLARLGGDEFGVLLRDCDDADAERLAAALIRQLESYRFVQDGHTFRVGLSIGIALVEGDESSVAQVLREADTACYIAKTRGRNRSQLYRQSDQEVARAHQDMEQIGEIEQALDDDRVLLYAQEIRDYAQDGLPAYELLVRLRRPDGGVMMPAQFLPTMERFGLVPKLDLLMARHALTLSAPERGLAGQVFSYLAVNLSGVSLSDETFVRNLLALLETQQGRAAHIRFEITETAVLANVACARRAVDQLRALGYKVLLDDFGNGFTSFDYLKSLQVDGIKVDQSYIRNLVSDPVNRAIVQCIGRISAQLKLVVVAEGVEDDDTLSVVRKLGIDHVQGFLLHRTEPFDRAIARRLPGVAAAV